MRSKRPIWKAGSEEGRKRSKVSGGRQVIIILDRLCEIKVETRNLASPSCKTSAPRATELCNAKGDEEKDEDEEVAALFSLPTIHAWELKEAAIFLSLTDLDL